MSAGGAGCGPKAETGGRAGLAACAAVLALGLWHFLDVRAGAAQSGNGWLVGWYAALLVFGLLLLTALWKLARSRARLEYLFGVSCLGLGLMFLFVLPPLSAPDEVSHYISAYQLSNRLLGWPADDGEGHVYIRAQDIFLEDVTGALARTDDGRAAETDGAAETVILGQELTQQTYAKIHARGLGGQSAGLQMPANAPVLSYQPSVRTTPLAYLPQALGMTLARVLGLGGLGLVFLGRLMNLLFFTAMGMLALRRLPFGKAAAAGVFLLPMSLHLAASLSYDVMIIACSGYFGAVCLDLAYRAERVCLRDVAALAAVMAVMGPCKMVYGVIAGWCLLIPVRKFGSLRRWGISAAAVLGAFALAMVLVNRSTVAMYARAEASYVGWAQAEGYTLSGLLHSPLFVLQMCYNTLMWQGENLFSGMLGAALGNMDAVLNAPYAVLLAMCAILAVLALREPGEPVYFTWSARLWIWALAGFCLGALMFSMLLAWTPVGAGTIQGVQGRYLLPLLPMLLLTLRGGRILRQGIEARYLLYAMAVLEVYVVWRLFAIVCLRV